MKEKVTVGTWTSAASRQRFLAMEDALWARSTRRREAFDVETGLGPTRAYRWRGTGTPIVFLHGVSGTSLAWARYAERLDGRDVVAVDIIGDVGRSEQRLAITGPEDMAAWLDETLAALGIEHAHVVGLSLGGFIALATAIHRPARVQSLVLFDPGGIAPLQFLRFMLWGLPILFGSLAPAPVRRWIGRRFRMPLLEDREVMRMALYGQLHHRARFPRPVTYTDDELRSISMPVTLLVGEKTEVFDADELISRARRLLPHASVEVVPGAGHALTESAFELCASRVSHVTDATL
jgi:pimeloyl-ACP methyl ester carboxylesterase